jgi:hypothetical protein
VGQLVVQAIDILWQRLEHTFHTLLVLEMGKRRGFENMIKQTSEKINIGKCDVMSKANTQTYEPVYNIVLCSVTKCTACTFWSTPIFKLKSSKQNMPHSCVCVCVCETETQRQRDRDRDRETETERQRQRERERITHLRCGGKMLVVLCDNFYEISILLLEEKGKSHTTLCVRRMFHGPNGCTVHQ